MRNRSLLCSVVLISTLFASRFTFAVTHDLFKGEALEKGKLVYVEKHDVTLDDQGHPLEAETTYVNPEGKVLGILKSDFRKSLNLPEHEFEDKRTNVKYGIRRSGGKIVMFSQDPGQPEKTKQMDEADGSERLQVGCQGFNYYLNGKVDQVKDQGVLPVLFMIPGELSTYHFKLIFVRDNPDQTAEFKVKIESWFLRLFAPELQFRYDRKKNRIVWYRGISNIKNDAGKLMDVTIDYKY